MDTLKDLQLVRALAPSRGLELRSASDGQMPTMLIRFSPFNTWYEIDSVFEGRFLERTVPGSFGRTINNSQSKMQVLFDHGFDSRIGNMALGPILSLREEADSPVAEVGLLDTSYNRDLLPGLQAGLYGSSMRFSVVQDKWDDRPRKSDYNPLGLPERTITEARVREFGPVTFPANPAATAGLLGGDESGDVRSLTDHFYERLRANDPKVEELLARARALRTPQVAPVREDTAPEGLAESEVGPAESHPTGLLPRERRERLYPYLVTHS